MTITGGPIKTLIAATLNYGMDKIIPEELVAAKEELVTNLSIAGITYLSDSYFDETQDLYNNPNEGDLHNDVQGEVDGLSWIAEAITGFMPGKRGTNTPKYIREEDAHSGSGSSSNNANGTLILPKKAGYTNEKYFDEHAIYVNKIKKNGLEIYEVDRQNGIKGGHNQIEFEKALEIHVAWTSKHRN